MTLTRFIIVVCALASFTGTAEARRYHHWGHSTKVQNWGYYVPVRSFEFGHLWVSPPVPVYRTARAVQPRAYKPVRVARVTIPRHAKAPVKAPQQADVVGDAIKNTVTAVTQPVSNMLSIVNSYIGTNPTHRRTLWCAAFVAVAARKVGYRIRTSNPDWAANWLGEGVKSDGKPGDVVVSSHHATFLKRKLGNGYIEVTGGNQGGPGVNTIRMRAASVLGYRSLTVAYAAQ